MRFPTIEYVVGADLDDLGLFVRSNGQLIDLSAGYSFALKVGDGTSGTGGFTSTVGFTGGTGSGLPPSGTPNLTKEWQTTGELNALTGGKTYLAQLTMTRDSDGKQRIRQFYLRMLVSA